MKAIIKGRWIIFSAWIIFAVLLTIFSPNLGKIVEEKGDIQVPEGYPSTLASDLLEEADQQSDEGTGSATVLVFHDEKGLSKKDMSEVKKAVNLLKENEKKLGITSLISHFEEKELEDQLLSKDGKTVLVVLSVQLKNKDTDVYRSELHSLLKDIKVDHYFTGKWLIDDDVIATSQKGLKKTELITVVFILGILFVVFRSLVAPFVPLFVVGLSYVISQSIVAILTETVNFPISTFTQIFMVAIMFGIGTDYCILLISRFKEELAHAESIQEAVEKTYKTAGKTVFFSGLAVFIGFASIGLSTFILYQSAVAVAVGVAVVLIAIATIVPFFMVTLGQKLFFPSKGSLEHKESKLWDVAGRFAIKRPLITLLIIAVIVVPVLINYDGKLSFNSLDEIGDKYETVQAFNIISESFGPGQALPATIVIKHDEKMDSKGYLALVEGISREVARIDGVDVVRSATRPTGEVIKDFYVVDQVKTLDEGLGKGTEGIKQINDGLSDANQTLKKSSPNIDKAVSGIDELVNGTTQLKTGITELQDGLTKIEEGMAKGANGSADLALGIKKIRENAAALQVSNQKLLAGYEDVEKNLNSFSASFKDAEQSLVKISATLSGLNQNFTALTNKYPNLATDQDFLTVKGTVNQVKTNTETLANGLKTINENFAPLQSGMQNANQGFNQAVNGQKQLGDSLAGVEKGLVELEKGLHAASNGQSQVISKLPQMTNGITKINGGQMQLKSGFGELSGQLDKLISGLDQSTDGLSQVSSGLDDAQEYVNGLSTDPNKQMAGWHIPDEALNDENFQKALDIYMSKDRQIITLDVIFDENPYANKTLGKIDDIERAVKRATAGTKLEGATVGIAGATSIYHDLQKISDADYARTVIFMLVGISVILILLLRSLIMPIYLIASLILTYFSSLAFTELIFVNILGYNGITWVVPFFSFVILVALGIDYSIFLMDRFNEFKEMHVEDAILAAMRNMGTVIISAVVILGGTFAAMYPSGVLSLLQIATVVLIGLVLYALVFLPLFVPVMVKTFGIANWWPFKMPKVNRNN